MRYTDTQFYDGERWLELQEHEKRFITITKGILGVGRIPGPTELNEHMGTKRRNHLGGRLSKVRRAVFESNGVVKNETTGRWEWGTRS